MVIIPVLNTILFAASAYFITRTTSTVSDGLRLYLLYFSMFATGYYALNICYSHASVFLGMLDLSTTLGAFLWGFGILQYIDGLEQSNVEYKGTELEQLTKFTAICNIVYSTFIIVGAGGLLGKLMSDPLCYKTIVPKN